HASGVDMEERVIRTRQRATVEGDPERVRRGVRVSHDAFDLVEVAPAFGSGRGQLVDGERTGDTAPVAGLVAGRRRNIVGDPHNTYVDPVGTQPVGGDAEVEPISRVVAEAQYDTGATVGRASDPVDLLGRRGREDVAEHRAVGEARTDGPGVGGERPRGAPGDVGDLAGGRPALSAEARGVGNAFDVGGRGGGETRQYTFLERVRIVEDVGHGSLTESSRYQAGSVTLRSRSRSPCSRSPS